MKRVEIVHRVSLDAMGILRTTKMRRQAMADPTMIIDHLAPTYAHEMGEDWEQITEERKLQWRVLAYKTYEAHVANKIQGFELAIEAVEGVQVAPSTPKSWLRGVQEAKNALVWVLDGFVEGLETRVEVPESVPEDFDAEDPYADLRAGDEAPLIPVGAKTCGAMHEDNWVCSREPHPAHWVHMDCDPGEFYDEDGEPVEELEGMILATWRDGQRLESLHPALGDIDE